MVILMKLILPIHEHGRCFHLFVSLSVSFFSVLQFSKYSSFTLLFRFIPMYLIYFVAVVMELFSQFLFLIVHYWCIKNAINFWVFISYPATLLNSFIRSSRLLMESWWICIHNIMLSVKKWQFYFIHSNLDGLYFFFLYDHCG